MFGVLKRLLRRSSILLGLVRAVRHSVTWPLARGRIVRRYLKAAEVRKLHLGAGPDYLLDGWLNSDVNPVHSRGVAYVDARKRLPFPDGTFDYVQSEHMIEHLTYPEGLAMLGECFRVLKAGGTIRTATPDLRVFVDLFGSERSDEQERYIEYHMDKFLPDIGARGPCFVINNALRNWGHQFLYDRETLAHSIEKAGFVDLADHRSGESDDEVLRGIEFHGNVVGNEEMNRFETMVIEARKPG
ncbi:MAG: class I SAM-dependent methyltransferase [Planctomycetota bacterium]|jgi:predicted SAM-dependent methyltransferase